MFVGALSNSEIDIGFISFQEPLNELYPYNNMIDHTTKKSLQAEAWEEGMCLEKSVEFSQNTLQVESALPNFSNILSDDYFARITSNSDNYPFKILNLMIVSCSFKT